MVKVADTPLPKRLESGDLAVSMCAKPNGQGTSGLKMEPKCMVTIQTTELGNPLALLLQVGQSQERYNAQEERMPEEADAAV